MGALDGQVLAAGADRQPGHPGQTLATAGVVGEGSTTVAHFIPNQRPTDISLVELRIPNPERPALTASGNISRGGDIWTEAIGV